MEIIIVWCVVGFLFGLLGSYVSTEKGRSAGVGMTIGFFFGPLGCLILALLPTKTPIPASTPASSADRRPPSRAWAQYEAIETEPGEMPEDWGRQVREMPKKKPRPAQDDGVDMSWLNQ